MTQPLKIHGVAYHRIDRTLCNRGIGSVVAQGTDVHIHKNGKLRILVTEVNSKVNCKKCQVEL